MSFHIPISFLPHRLPQNRLPHFANSSSYTLTRTGLSFVWRVIFQSWTHTLYPDYTPEKLPISARTARRNSLAKSTLQITSGEKIVFPRTRTGMGKSDVTIAGISRTKRRFNEKDVNLWRPYFLKTHCAKYVINWYWIDFKLIDQRVYLYRA